MLAVNVLTRMHRLCLIQDRRMTVGRREVWLVEERWFEGSLRGLVLNVITIDAHQSSRCDLSSVRLYVRLLPRRNDIRVRRTEFCSALTSDADEDSLERPFSGFVARHAGYGCVVTLPAMMMNIFNHSSGKAGVAFCQQDQARARGLS